MSSTATSAPARCTRMQQVLRRQPRARCDRRRTCSASLSLIVWSLLLIVTRQVHRARHARGQPRRGRHPGADRAGRSAPSSRRAADGARSLLGVFGAALLYGDGMITPAISVLGAVEGLEVATPSLSRHRRADHARHPDRPVRRPARGTARVGALFGPIMAVWFVVIALLGCRRDREHIRACSGAVTRRTAATFLADDPARRLRRARRRVPGGHRRRGAVRRHGPLRAAGRSASPGSRSSSPR